MDDRKRGIAERCAEKRTEKSINQSINQKKFVLETTTMNIVGLAIVATRYDI